VLEHRSKQRAESPKEGDSLIMGEEVHHRKGEQEGFYLLRGAQLRV
jgi:hypothetical protein